MIKRRNMGMQVLLMIITLGIYGIYWFYVTSKEMVEYKRLDGSPGFWTVLSLIPFVNLYAAYKQGEAVEALTDGSVNRWIIFILWLVFSPAVWFITQTELNKRDLLNPRRCRNQHAWKTNHDSTKNVNTDPARVDPVAPGPPNWTKSRTLI